MDGHLSGWIDESGVSRDRKERVVIITYTENGEEWAGKLWEVLREEYEVLCCIHSDGGTNLGRKSRLYDLLPEAEIRKFILTDEILREEFVSASLLIFISATGIAVRELAPYLKNHGNDPAVLVMDDMAIHVISLVSGRIGGANEWCREISALTGAEAVITTSADLHGRFTVDLFAKENKLLVEDPALIKEVSKRVLRSQPIGVFSDFSIRGALPKGFFAVGKSGKRRKAYAMHPECGVVVVNDPDTPKKFEVECRLFPKNLFLGISCKPGTTLSELYDFIAEELSGRVPMERLLGIATSRSEKEEPCILELAERLGKELLTFSAEELENADGDFDAEDLVKEEVGTGDVCERSAVCAAGRGASLFIGKRAKDGMAFAVASAGSIDLRF